jgi:glycosyltransferase involved in cell wall biosynthesis
LEKNSVAVVIAHYNGAHFIERALQSAFDQTIRPAEVLVVDDGSSPEELAFLRGLQNKFDFKLVEQMNAGQSAARNEGVMNSSSEFICLLDQDDYFLPNHIEILLGPIGSESDHSRLAFTYGDVWRGSEEGIVITHSCVHDTGPQPKNRIIELISSDMMILPSASLIRRSSFLEIGGFDPQFRGYEDDDLFLRFFSEGYDSIFIDKAVTFWTINTSSTSYTETMSRSRFRYYKKLMSTFPEGSLPNIPVFDHLIAPRFAFQFIADVLSAAVNRSENFSERQSRLREFRIDYIKCNRVDVNRMKKLTFLIRPLASLNLELVRALVLVAARLPRIIGNAVHPQAVSFIRGQVAQARVEK